MKDYKHYYELYYSSPYCGTDTTEIIASNSKYHIDEDEIREDLYASYGYLINGFYGDDPTEEEYEEFIAECTVCFKEISQEEFLRLYDDGYAFRVE